MTKLRKIPAAYFSLAYFVFLKQNIRFVISQHFSYLFKYYNNQICGVLGFWGVDVDLASIIGHAIIWILLSIVTLGLALIVYQFAVLKRLLNGVTIR